MTMSQQYGMVTLMAIYSHHHDHVSTVWYGNFDGNLLSSTSSCLNIMVWSLWWLFTLIIMTMSQHYGMVTLVAIYSHHHDHVSTVWYGNFDGNLLSSTSSCLNIMVWSLWWLFTLIIMTMSQHYDMVTLMAIYSHHHDHVSTVWYGNFDGNLLSSS